MIVPSREQCLYFMGNHRMPPHIREHSRKVAEIAIGLGTYLNCQGRALAIALLDAGGLLHDIAKARCLRTGENHAVVGGRMVRQLGYPLVANIVEEHVRITASDLDGPVSEALLVNYADKRVKHTEIVTLEERFGDLADRYGHTAERKARLKKNLSLFVRLEEKIFGGLAIQPEDVLTWTKSVVPTACGSSGMTDPVPADLVIRQ